MTRSTDPLTGTVRYVCRDGHQHVKEETARACEARPSAARTAQALFGPLVITRTCAKCTTPIAYDRETNCSSPHWWCMYRGYEPVGFSTYCGVSYHSACAPRDSRGELQGPREPQAVRS